MVRLLHLNEISTLNIFQNVKWGETSIRRRTATLTMRISLKWFLLVAFVQSTLGFEHDICEISTLSAGGIGTSGDIISPHYPEDMVQSKSCRLTLTACAECRITLNFTRLQFPNCSVDGWSRGNCVFGCYHMYVHEPDYPVETTNYYFSEDEGDTYTSVSNKVYLVLCVADKHYDGVKFRIDYHISEKFTEFTGTQGKVNSSGYITSPNFPRGYAVRNEVFTYLIQNTDPSGFVRLQFNDWNLSPNSRITIYFHNNTHPVDYLTTTGKDERPFLVSRGPVLYIKFETGEDLYSIPYVGFRAFYQFVKEPEWPNKPSATCGEYYHSVFGGYFNFDERHCRQGHKVDCVWVIMKYEDRLSDIGQVSLHVTKLDISSGDDKLEIRTGNSSQAPLLRFFDIANPTAHELVSKDGFYVRLQATCSAAKHFTAVFTSFLMSTEEGCEHLRKFRCANNRCISFTLKCDGFDHCGDNSDEFNCAATALTTAGKSCSTHYSCRSGKGWYCVEEQCDGSWDCSDGSDEKNCWMTDSPTAPPSHSGFLHYHNWGTYIPIGLVAVLLAIIACIVISCCARRKHSRRRRQQRALANRMGIAGNVLPESPPTYEEAMQTTSAAGVRNMAYTSTDSMDTFLPLPPPYTPNADDPLPIIYQLAASQSTPDIHSNFRPISISPAVAGVHGRQLGNASDSDTRRSRSSNGQNQNCEGRRTRSRHRRRRSRGTNQNPASEDRSALISAAQDTAVNSSQEDNSIIDEDNTRSNTNTQQCRDIPAGATATDNTNVSNSVNNEDDNICGNSLTDNVIMNSSERGEFIELGDTLTIPPGVDPDRLTLQSETSGSFYSGADSASGCSTLDQTSVSSLQQGKTHRRSVSGVSWISKTSMEPSVSKVDEEPCECKCSCKCDCKHEVSFGEICSECDKPTNKEDASFTEITSNSAKNSRAEDSSRITEQISLDPQNSSRDNVITDLACERNDTASFV